MTNLGVFHLLCLTESKKGKRVSPFEGPTDDLGDVVDGPLEQAVESMKIAVYHGSVK
jgi:hypothetical protein